MFLLSFACLPPKLSGNLRRLTKTAKLLKKTWPKAKIRKHQNMQSCKNKKTKNTKYNHTKKTALKQSKNATKKNMISIDRHPAQAPRHPTQTPSPHIPAHFRTEFAGTPRGRIWGLQDQNSVALSSLLGIHAKSTISTGQHVPKWRICAWLDGISSSKTVPKNMPSSHAQIRTDRGTSPTVYPTPVPIAVVSPHCKYAGIWGVSSTPFMRVTTVMRRHLVTARESQSLPPLTPRWWKSHNMDTQKNDLTKNYAACVVVCVMW